MMSLCAMMMMSLCEMMMMSLYALMMPLCAMIMPFLCSCCSMPSNMAVKVKIHSDNQRYPLAGFYTGFVFFGVGGGQLIIPVCEAQC